MTFITTKKRDNSQKICMFYNDKIFVIQRKNCNKYIKKRNLKNMNLRRV